MPTVSCWGASRVSWWPVGHSCGNCRGHPHYASWTSNGGFCWRLVCLTNARRLIANAIIGYILFLAAWMLVDTGLRFLLRQENYGVWNDIMCEVQPVPQPRS